MSNSEDLCNYAESIVTIFLKALLIKLKLMTQPIDQILLIRLLNAKAHLPTQIDPTTYEIFNRRTIQTLSDHQFLYDVPRLRIVPNSNFLSSGISYNYKPHRDTWYGASQDQLNHWMAVSNVTKQSTFYLAPSYFEKPIENNSEIFDLDEWDSKHRKLASKNVGSEERPHPIPLVELAPEDKYEVVIPKGSEIAFSGFIYTVRKPIQRLK